jgi:primosomal protein N' (replication factor Y) (superfamily II helicase)
VPEIAKVEPLTTARALRGPFDYRLGAEHAGVDVGSVLVVPFGHRRVLGVVTSTASESDVEPERLAEPLSALEADVPAALVSLGLWVAEEYCSTPARGLALVLPPGTGTGSGRPLRAKRSLLASLTLAGYQSTERPGRLGQRQIAALRGLAGGPQRASQLVRASGCDHAGLRRLEELGLIELKDKAEPARRPELAEVGAEPVSAELTHAQRLALGDITAALDRGESERLLLHGVTGSGKTEVYLQAAEETLARGRSAIVLVPEIALTPQTAGRFVRRFGDRVAVLHSALTARERFDEWARLRSGEARVCVGPRSAVFAPVEDLGLIVVDEEHDPSYKQEGDPRYDARWVAERRAEGERAVLLAGTATPRPEAWHALRRLSLPERVDGRGLPPVEVVSSLEATGALHPRTREALEEVRRREEKAIVLLNRRGWSNFLSCRTCGRSWGCPGCDVTLVLHRSAGHVSCHHCGHSEPVPGACPDCGSVSIARHGAGTEQLGRELEDLVAPLPVVRLDTDSAAATGVGPLLERFEREPAAVLVGTQMVAKGHDFPDVTLGVVLDADATLRFPDFRAEERTFALVCQLAGRSGRGRRGGKVIVQALEPGARPLRHAAEHDAEGFTEGELQRRRVLRYPPFGNLIRVVCSSEEPGPEQAAAEAVAERLEIPDAIVLGPAPLFRRQGRERSQLVVKAADRSAGIAAVRRAVEEVSADRAHGEASFAVDVDPQ